MDIKFNTVNIKVILLDILSIIVKLYWTNSWWHLPTFRKGASCCQHVTREHDPLTPWHLQVTFMFCITAWNHISHYAGTRHKEDFWYQSKFHQNTCRNLPLYTTWLTGGQTQSARSNMDFIDLGFESCEINFNWFWNFFYFKTYAKQSSKLLTLVTGRSAHIHILIAKFAIAHNCHLSQLVTIVKNDVNFHFLSQFSQL